MQYIKKQNNPPANWDMYFTKAGNGRSYDYGLDFSSLTNLTQAKSILIIEQHGLCAYCQQIITEETSSIEHVIPKALNKELSTSYYNLVAVCKSPLKDPETDRQHCDKEKGSRLIIPIIFVSNAEATLTTNNNYFAARSDGSIVAKPTLLQEHKNQVDSFIEVLNLNHSLLKQKRVKDVLDGMISVYSSIQGVHKNSYWKTQYKRLLLNPKQPFRQFLLIFIGNKIGIN